MYLRCLKSSVSRKTKTHPVDSGRRSKRSPPSQAARPVTSGHISTGGETLQAQWGEINLEAAMWNVPATRMRARREHRIPLAGTALAILGSGEVSRFPCGPSEMTLARVVENEVASLLPTWRPVTKRRAIMQAWGNWCLVTTSASKTDGRQPNCVLWLLASP